MPGGWANYAAQAQVVLLHIGTNDLLQNNYGSPAAAADDMGPKLHALIQEIYNYAPSAHVYVASIISFSNVDQWRKLNEQRLAYNAKIPGIVNKFKRSGKHATFVDMTSAR